MKSTLVVPAVAAIVAVALALAIFGWRIADPGDVSWITGDAVTGLFGWKQYFTDPAHLYPMVSDRYSYPLTMPIAMFDIVPSAAFVVKLLASGESWPVQYFGPLFLIGAALQALAGWALLREVTPGKSGPAYQFSLLIGALFFATAPILIVRFYFTHMSLSSQWPIIVSLLIYARSPRFGFWRNIRDFSLINLLSTAINPYLMVMTLLIFGAWFIKQIMEKSLTWMQVIYCTIPLECAIAGLIAFGFIDPGSKGAVGVRGFGLYSANFLTFIDPMSYYLGSQFVPDLQIAQHGQYEGFGYLGMGALLLIAGGLVVARWRRDDGGGLYKPLFAVMAMAWLLAMSNVLTFGPYKFEVPIPDILLSILQNFRSSGRFVWVTIYGLLFIAIASLIRRETPGRAALFLSLAAVVQIADLAGPLTTMHQRFAEREGSDKFYDAAFAELGQGHDRLIVLPPWQCRTWGIPRADYPSILFLKFSNLAMDSNLPTNSFYAGRTPMGQALYHCETFPRRLLLSAPAEKRTAYILTPRTFGEFGAHIAASHYCDFAEDMFICRGDRAAPGLSARAKHAAAVTPPAATGKSAL